MNSVKNKLAVGHAIENAISDAVSAKDRSQLEALRDFCRQTASKIDGIISGLPHPAPRKNLYW